MSNLKAILRGGESATLEFKEVCPAAHRLARVIAAFANSAGGHLVVGVDDRGGIVGLEDLAKERGVIDLAIDHVEPRPEIEVTKMTHELKDVFVVRVEPIEFPTICHITINGEELAYFRIGKETRPVAWEAERLAVRLRRYGGGVRELSREGQKLVSWLWSAGEKKEPVCARRFNYSTHRLRKLAEQAIAAGYLLPCNMGSGRSYVAIHPGPGKKP